MPPAAAPPVGDTCATSNGRTSNGVEDVPTIVEEFVQSPPTTTRFSIFELERLHKMGHKKPLEDVIRAWKGIQELEPTNPDSFFIIGGYHGEPFVPRTNNPGKKEYWGGWCNHGNVLFPTWHRAYLYRLEQALQSIVPGVALPFFDETSPEALENGLPDILTCDKVELDGEMIPNPLKSFKLPKDLRDYLPSDPNYKKDKDGPYTKPAGYETVRYPYSGVVTTEEDRENTKEYNAQFSPSQAVKLLNQNYITWMKGTNESVNNNDAPGVSPNDPTPKYNGVFHQYVNCLLAPNYTAFSNTTSAGQWAVENKGYTFALEDPHNDVHIAIGGYAYGTEVLGQQAPNRDKSGHITAGANGDMGENNTAALDPIFFFHHCNVDRMFWLWQKKHKCTDKLEIYQDLKNYPEGYPGTKATDGFGPTPYYNFNDILSMESPLQPFQKPDGTWITSNDMVNIEKQLGYTYGPGSLDLCGKINFVETMPVYTKKLRIFGINRDKHKGSWTIHAAVSWEGGEQHLGHFTVLARTNSEQCANCQNHQEINAIFPITGSALDEYNKSGSDAFQLHVSYKHRDPVTKKSVVTDVDAEDYEYAYLD